MTRAMAYRADPPAPCAYTLREGEQIVVNGALITAIRDCDFLVNVGASVIGGRLLFDCLREPKPAHALYYASLDAASSLGALKDASPRLFVLLAQTVARHRTRTAQDLCSAYARGLVARDVDAVLDAARTLAESEAETGKRVARNAS